MDPSSPPKVVLDLASSLGTPGFRLVDAGELLTLFNNVMGFTGVVLGAGTTQAAATPLKPGVNAFIASGGNTGVVLPTGLPGQQVVVVNYGAVGGVLYGNGGDQIIPMASNAQAPSLAMAAGTSAVLVCVNKNQSTGVVTWKVLSLG